MRTRILTGLVGIPIILFCIFGPWFMTCFFAFALMAILNLELAQMAAHGGLISSDSPSDAKAKGNGAKAGNTQLVLVLAMINMLLFFAAYLFLSKDMGLLFVLMSALIMIETVFSFPRLDLRKMVYLMFMAVYANWLPMHMLGIRLLDNGAWLLLSVFIMVWVCDSGAYFSGRFFGKHKMSPQLSPKKTVEGAIGGVLLTILAAFIVNHFVTIATAWWAVTVLALLAAIGAIVGDLFESYLKRSFGVKDSGNILPGHGGFADRFDSFIMVAPLALCYFQLAL